MAVGMEYLRHKVGQRRTLTHEGQVKARRQIRSVAILEAGIHQTDEQLRSCCLPLVDGLEQRGGASELPRVGDMGGRGSRIQGVGDRGAGSRGQSGGGRRGAR